MLWHVHAPGSGPVVSLLPIKRRLGSVQAQCAHPAPPAFGGPALSAPCRKRSPLIEASGTAACCSQACCSHEHRPYLAEAEGLLAPRVALPQVLIFDWDVHHGNGTQDVFESDPDVLFISTHQASERGPPPRCLMCMEDMAESQCQSRRADAQGGGGAAPARHVSPEPCLSRRPCAAPAPASCCRQIQTSVLARRAPVLLLFQKVLRDMPPAPRACRCVPGHRQGGGGGRGRRRGRDHQCPPPWGGR